MTHIKQTEIVPPQMIVAAKCYHQGQGGTRVRVARMYMASENRDGSGMQEYLLTRYITQQGVAMSSILKVILPPSSAEADATSLGDGGSERKAANAARNMITLEKICLMTARTRRDDHGVVHAEGRCGMRPAKLDLKNVTFGRLTALEKVEAPVEEGC